MHVEPISDFLRGWNDLVNVIIASNAGACLRRYLHQVQIKVPEESGVWAGPGLPALGPEARARAARVQEANPGTRDPPRAGPGGPKPTTHRPDKLVDLACGL